MDKDMRIAKAEVFVHSPGRNFVTLRITTEGGLVGNLKIFC